MKMPFNNGDQKDYRHVVKDDEVAAFHGTTVHRVYATFALARDAEWTTRQFVLEMCDADEEGVGTFLSINHKSPAFVGEEIIFTAWIDAWDGRELICAYEAKVGERLVAEGKTGQKILKKEKLRKLFGEQ
jgi:predicted thioesterase